MTHTNPNMLMEQVKSMAITMLMVRTTGNESSSIFNTIIIMIFMYCIDSIMLFVRHMATSAIRQFETYVANTDIPCITPTTTCLTKKASIIIKNDPESKTLTSAAIVDILTNLPETKCVLLTNAGYTINYDEEIQITKDIYAKMTMCSDMQLHNPRPDTKVIPSISTESSGSKSKSKISATTSSSSSSDTEHNAEPELYSYIDLYSYTLTMEDLRKYMNDVVLEYTIKMKNKLGGKIYYFSESPVIVHRRIDNSIDYTKLPQDLQFRMNLFTTNRTFQNLFGHDMDVIRKRVLFFRDNKDWYDAKGIPYTLGILVSGKPGSGKTSLLKCIANEMKRHIINIHLSETISKTQLENLFYSDQIQVTQNGKTELFTIPIHKRIYVLEDVDCQCDIVLEREKKSDADADADADADLAKNVSRLKPNPPRNDKFGGPGISANNPNPMKTSGDENDKQHKITLSFLLNLFDGVLETPGRIIFVTTNFIEKLDRAFTRPGRIDIIRNFEFSDAYQMKQMIEHRYDAQLTQEQEMSIQSLPSCVTPAELSRILFENLYSMDDAIRDLVKYAEQAEQIRARKDETAEEL